MALSTQPNDHDVSAPSFPLKGSRVPHEDGIEVTESLLKAFETVKRCLRVQDALPDTPDLVVVCGSDLLHVVKRAAKLYHEYSCKGQMLPLVVTGGRGKLTPPSWPNEAEVFARRLSELAVPLSQIILETKADTMTANMRNSRQHVRQILANARVGSLIIITDDAQLRRAVLTAQKEFPDFTIVGCAPGHFDLQSAPEGWSIPEWQQRVLWTVVNELGRLVKYQREGTAQFAPFPISDDHLEAAIRVGDHLQRDRSVPDAAQEHLRMWITELTDALGSRVASTRPNQ